MARRRKQNTEVVRVDPQPQQQYDPSNVPTVYTDQNGQVWYQDRGTGNMVPAPQQQPQQGGIVPGVQQGQDFTGFQGTMGVRHNPDGTKTYVTDGHVVSHHTEAAPGPGPGAYDGYIGGRWSKRRMAIGIVLALLILMIAADVLGLPHYRTSPGVYVGLEGEKTTDKTDLPMIALIRLDRSVFGYSADGIGWAFGVIGGMLEGEKTTSDPSQL